MYKMFFSDKKDYGNYEVKEPLDFHWNQRYLSSIKSVYLKYYKLKI